LRLTYADKNPYKYSILSLSGLILFFLSAILASQTILNGDIVSVPDVSGKNLNEARQTLSLKKLIMIEDGSRPSDRYEKGRVVFQDPEAGSKVRVNKVVKLVVSEGSEMTDIPQLTGKSLEYSTQTLAEHGLIRGKLSQIHTPRYAAGRIIVQDPLPGPEKVKSGRPVNLLVSRGDEEEKYVMPDLLGLKAQAVIAKLKSWDFKFGNIRYSYYPGYEAGIIIKQFPLQGYRIQKRNLINLEVSK